MFCSNKVLSFVYFFIIVSLASSPVFAYADKRPKNLRGEIEKLEQLYSEGDLKAQNDLISCYQQLSEKGDSHAQYNLGVMHESGLGVKKNLKKAVALYQKAADQGYAMAQYNLGVMYEYGEGVEKNPQKAVEFYQKAADQGYEVAKTKLRDGSLQVAP